MRVLVVEDEEAIAEPLAEGLRREGFAVTVASTAAEALAAAEADVVLLDLRLPDGDGLDVCRELRSRSDVPIIVVTARGEEVDRVFVASAAFGVNDGRGGVLRSDGPGPLPGLVE